MSDIPLVGGRIYELKTNVSNEANLQKVFEAAKKDNTDNVIGYDQKSQKSYMICKDGMKLSEEMKKGAVPSVMIPVNGKSVELEVKAVNNQVNTLKEGVNNPIVKGLAALGFGTAAVSTAVTFTSQALFSQGTNVHLIDKYYTSMVVSSGLAKIGLAVGAAALVGGALYGAIRKHDDSKTSEFIDKRVGVLTD